MRQGLSLVLLFDVRMNTRFVIILVSSVLKRTSALELVDFCHDACQVGELPDAVLKQSASEYMIIHGRAELELMCEKYPQFLNIV